MADINAQQLVDAVDSRISEDREPDEPARVVVCRGLEHFTVRGEFYLHLVAKTVNRMRGT